MVRPGRPGYDSAMLLLVDLDGVVYRGATPIPGVAAALADRAARGDIVVYVTNNAMHDRDDYVTKLSGMGAPVTADRVVSSARATALYLADAGLEPAARRVLVVGAGGLERECRDAGLEVVTATRAAARQAQEGIDGWEAAGRPDVVVVGLDPEFTYQKLAVAVECVQRGARFVATNRDPVFPTEHGTRPGAGAIVAAVEAGSQVVPVSIGKPAPLLLELAIRAAGRGLTRDDAVMVGDGLLTDLAAANNLGILCVLMLTGVTTREQAEALPPGERPAAVAADAGELLAALDGLAARPRA
jgi:4-nitrophenyl phosphatase